LHRTIGVLRITQSTAPDGQVVLRVEGQLRDEWVHELRRLSSEILRQPGNRLELNLAEITFLDAGGTELLRELSLRHVALNDCSLFVAQQLEALEKRP
jgi:anti-anti-sigma regulatory factor